jgi:hypothetical protein
MSKWLKRCLFGIWGLLLIPLITPIREKWLEENPNGVATTAFPNAVATTVFNNLLALGHQRWFEFALVFLTGTVIGVSLEWLNQKSDEKKASELRSLGSKFRSLSDSLKIRTASSEWPDNVLILNLQSSQHLCPPRNSIYGYRTSTSTNCRMRHSFVNTSDVSASF